MFAPHPEAMLEELAARLIPCSISGDETIIEEGDEGGLFYLIAEGRLDVSAEGCHVATLGPGDFVGEIALLRDVPRLRRSWPRSRSSSMPSRADRLSRRRHERCRAQHACGRERGLSAPERARARARAHRPAASNRPQSRLREPSIGSGVRIAIVLFDGAEELDWAGPWEVLAAWAKQWPDDGVEVYTVADAIDPVTCAKGLRVLADHLG